jgi:small redox-active disulfide protein 2
MISKFAIRKLKQTNMKHIKVLGPGCAKCKTTYNNVLEAIKQTGIEAEVTKIEDIMEMMKYDVLTTPVLMIDDVIKVKGRVADINEIKQLLTT